jgi:small-conductance mechanosensitive channel
MSLTDDIIKFFEDRVLGENTMQDYVTAIGITLLSFALLYFIKAKGISFIKKRIEDKESSSFFVIREVAEIFNLLVIIVLSIYFGSQVLAIHDSIANILKILVVIIMAWYIGEYLVDIINHIFTIKIESGDDSNIHLLELFRKITLTITLGIILLWVLSSFGINITAFVAGLGVLGLATAFALQSVVADIFSAFIIYVDRPFKLGDTIKTKGFTGKVISIGIKSTRLKAADNTQVILSNRQLTSAEIVNFANRKVRRIEIDLDIDTSTPTATLKKIPEFIEKIITKENLTDYKRTHLVDIGEFSFKFKILYFINTENYTEMLDIKQTIYLKILAKFEKENINLPYPTQRIMIEKEI